MGPFDPPKESSPFDGPSGGSNSNGMLSPTPPGGNPPTPDGTDQGGNPPAPDPLPPSAAPFPGTASIGNGMDPAAPGGAAETPNGMGEGDLPQAGLPTMGPGLRSPMPPSTDFEWSVPTYEVADAEGDHYALESRAETMNVVAYGDATRRDRLPAHGQGRSLHRQRCRGGADERRGPADRADRSWIADGGGEVGDDGAGADVDHGGRLEGQLDERRGQHSARRRADGHLDGRADDRLRDERRHGDRRGDAALGAGGHVVEPVDGHGGTTGHDGGVPTPDSAAFVQWQALTDAQAYLRGLSSVSAKAEMTVDIDFYMLVRSELVAGRDPRVAVQAVLDGLEEGSRLGTGVATEGAAPPMQPEVDEFGTRWVRVEEGELPVPQTFERVVVLDGTHVPVPDNYETVRLTEDPGTQTVTVSSDTTAVVESMAVRPAPQSTDWGSTFDALNEDYMHYRRDSTWRVMAEYENSIEVLRDDLRRAITDFGGDASQYTSETPVAQLYNRVQELLGQADNADDARRIQEFLDGFNSRTYDVYSDFVQRADEFEGVRTGASFPLDKHIDQDALRDWLDKRFTDAMATADPANQASRDEVAFWQQAHVAVKEGRNPLQDLGDQIAYLLGKIDPNVPIEELPENQQVIARQIQNFQIQQQELIDILGDPAFHRSAATMGDDTFAPVHFVRPELGDPPPVGTVDIQTQLFDPEAVQEPTQLSGGTDAASGNYAANQEAINGATRTGLGRQGTGWSPFLAAHRADWPTRAVMARFAGATRRSRSSTGSTRVAP